MYILALLETYSGGLESSDIQSLYEEGVRLSNQDPEAVFGIWTGDGEDLVAIVHNGEIFAKLKLSFNIFDAGKAVLTEREQEVVALIAKGHTNREISIKLGISYSTAKNHLSSIFRKLDVSNRTEVAMLFGRESEVKNGS